MTKIEQILVTGANGFIGGWLVEAIYLSRKAGVRAGVRSLSSAARVGRFPVEIVPCDVLELQQLQRSMRGITSVVHCAVGSREVNVEGTRNVLSAAVRGGITRFIHLSTVEVYGNVRGVVDESFPLRSCGSEYGDSKIEAERLCWEANRHGMPVTVLRPSVVYGPFSAPWTMFIAERLKTRRWRTLQTVGEGSCNLLYVDDLITAILTCLIQERAVGEAFNVNGPEVITWNEFYRRLNIALELPPLQERHAWQTRFLSYGMQPVRFGAGVLLRNARGMIDRLYMKHDSARELFRQSKGALQVIPRPDELRLYSRRAVYSPEKAGRLIGYSPSVSVEEGLKRTGAWLRHHGFV